MVVSLREQCIMYMLYPSDSGLTVQNINLTILLFYLILLILLLKLVTIVQCENNVLPVYFGPTLIILLSRRGIKKTEAPLQHVVPRHNSQTDVFQSLSCISQDEQCEQQLGRWITPIYPNQSTIIQDVKNPLRIQFRCFNSRICQNIVFFSQADNVRLMIFVPYTTKDTRCCYIE